MGGLLDALAAAAVVDDGDDAMAPPDRGLIAALEAVLGVAPVAPARAAAPPAPPEPVAEVCITSAALRGYLAARAGADPARLPWPEDWWDRTDPGHWDACRKLWAFALLKQIEDMLIVTLRRAAGTERSGQRRDVSSNVGIRTQPEWVGCRDFHMVCALAGLDGEASADALRPAMADPALARAMLDRVRSSSSRPKRMDDR